MQQTCRPSNVDIQPITCNGWNHMHCLKYQAISTPDGITSSLYGPFYGNNNGPGIFNKSRFTERLESLFRMVSTNKRYSLYGDEAYSRSKHRTPPWRKSFQFGYEKKANTAMSKVRVTVELGFGKIVQDFSGVKWKYGNSNPETRPALNYMLVIIFKNFHTILNGSPVISIFHLEPPSLEDYIGSLMRSRFQNGILE